MERVPGRSAGARGGELGVRGGELGGAGGGAGGCRGCGELGVQKEGCGCRAGAKGCRELGSAEEGGRDLGVQCGCRGAMQLWGSWGGSWGVQGCWGHSCGVQGTGGCGAGGLCHAPLPAGEKPGSWGGGWGLASLVLTAVTQLGPGHSGWAQRGSGTLLPLTRRNPLISANPGLINLCLVCLLNPPTRLCRSRGALAELGLGCWQRRRALPRPGTRGDPRVPSPPPQPQLPRLPGSLVGKWWPGASWNDISKKMLFLLPAASLRSAERLAGRAAPGPGAGSTARPSGRLPGPVSLHALLIRHGFSVI